MSFITILLIAIGLSMDSLAVSISGGICMKPFCIKKSLKMALTMGIFQGGMTWLGWAMGIHFSNYITDFDHWIAFVLLSYLGRAAAFEPDRRPIPHFIRIYGTVAAQPLGSAVLRLQGSQGTDHQPSEFAISAYLKKIQCAGSVHTRRCILAQPAAYIRHPLH